MWLSGLAKPLSRLGLCRYETYTEGQPLKILLVGYNGAHHHRPPASMVAHHTTNLQGDAGNGHGPAAHAQIPTPCQMPNAWALLHRLSHTCEMGHPRTAGGTQRDNGMQGDEHRHRRPASTTGEGHKGFAAPDVRNAHGDNRWTEWPA